MKVPEEMAAVRTPVDGDDLLATMRQSLVYLLQENKAERDNFRMDTREVDALLEVLDA